MKERLSGICGNPVKIGFIRETSRNEENITDNARRYEQLLHICPRNNIFMLP